MTAGAVWFDREGNFSTGEYGTNRISREDAEQILEAQGALSPEQMLGNWFKEYADLGHWFDSAHGKCIRCGTPTIDLYEDGHYGPIRLCAGPPRP